MVLELIVELGNQSVDFFLFLDADLKEKENFFASCKKTGNVSLAREAKKKIFNAELTEDEAKEVIHYALTYNNENYLWEISKVITKFFGREITPEEVDCYVKSRMSKASEVFELIDVWTSAEKGCAVRASAGAMKDLAELTAKKVVSLCEEGDFDSAKNLLKWTNLFRRFPELEEKEKVARMFYQESARLLLGNKYAVRDALELIDIIDALNLPVETVDTVIRQLMKH